MFEWDETKRLATLDKHGIDFLDVVKVFLGHHVVFEARSEVEQRQVAVGPLNGQMIAVIYTVRGRNIRIVTARRARRNERERYQALYS